MPIRLLTFLVMVAYVPGVPSAGNVGRWAVLALGAAWLIWKVRARPTPAHWMLLGLLAWMSLGLLWSVSPADTAGEVLQWAVLAVWFMIAAEEPDLQPLAEGLLAGVAVNAAFVLAQLSGWDPVTVYQPNVGLFVSRNVSVEVGIVAFFMALWYERYWGLLGASVLIVAGGGAEGLVMFLAAGTFLFFLSLDRLGGWRPFVASAVTMALFSGAVLGSPHLAARLPIWEYAISWWQPLGYGLGSFGALRGHDFEFAHNEFLHYAFELGLGVVLMIGVIWYAFLAADVPGRVALAALLAAAAVWYPLHQPATGFLFAVLAGHLCGARGRDVRTQYQSRVDRGEGSAYGANHVALLSPGASGAGRHPLSLGPEHTPGSPSLSARGRGQ